MAGCKCWLAVDACRHQLSSQQYPPLKATVALHCHFGGRHGCRNACRTCLVSVPSSCINSVCCMAVLVKAGATRSINQSNTLSSGTCPLAACRTTSHSISYLYGNGSQQVLHVMELCAAVGRMIASSLHSPDSHTLFDVTTGNLWLAMLTYGKVAVIFKAICMKRQAADWSQCLHGRQACNAEGCLT